MKRVGGTLKDHKSAPSRFGGLPLKTGPGGKLKPACLRIDFLIEGDMVPGSAVL